MKENHTRFIALGVLTAAGVANLLMNSAFFLGLATKLRDIAETYMFYEPLVWLVPLAVSIAWRALTKMAILPTGWVLAVGAIPFARLFIFLLTRYQTFSEELFWGFLLIINVFPTPIAALAYAAIQAILLMPLWINVT